MIAVAILLQINLYRAIFGLTPIKMDSITCNFAKVRLVEVMKDFSHNGFWRRNIAYRVENLASGYTPDTIVYHWTQSPTHAYQLREGIRYGCVAQGYRKDGTLFTVFEGRK
jgi:uncharacterized protein YkwD